METNTSTSTSTSEEATVPRSEAVVVEGFDDNDNDYDNDGSKSFEDANLGEEELGSKDFITKLLDRYPFNASQINSLLRIYKQQQQQQQQQKEEEKEEVKFSDFMERSSSMGMDANAIRWIEEHLIPSSTLQSFLTPSVHTCTYIHTQSDFMEHMAKITGRKGDPNYELIQIYNQVVNNNTEKEENGGKKEHENENENENEKVQVAGADIPSLLDLTYRLALSCHVLQHWNINDNDNDNDNNSAVLNLNQIKQCLEYKNTAMIASLTEFHEKGNGKGNMDGGYGYECGYGYGQAPDTQSTISSKISCQTWLDWAELNFPHMSCILSSFIHLALLSTSPLVKVDGNGNGNGNGDPSEEEQHENDEEEALRIELDKSSLYALGKRTMFRFPTLEKWITSKTRTVTKGKEKGFGFKGFANAIATVNVESAIIDYQGGGRIGHFAFSLVLMDARLCGKWNRMYSTETDGFAFLNLQRAMTGYDGPTIMMIRPTNASSIYSTSSSSSPSSTPSPGLFGVYTTNPWKESKTFHGTSDCFLFRADPTWNIYRPKQLTQQWNGNTSTSVPMKVKENYMYFHPSAGHVNTGGGGGQGIYGQLSRSRQGGATNSKPRGLVIGGTMKDPRLHITESLEQCIASSGGPMDGTFDTGPLLPGQWDKYFNVDILEVWGVGGEEVIVDAVNAKGKHEGVAEATRRRVQMVDKKQFLEDFQSGLHVGSKLFAHRDGSVRHNYGVDLEAERGCTSTSTDVE